MEKIIFESTPIGIAAYRDGQCWCDKCRSKNLVGYGKTNEEAEKDLLEVEAAETQDWCPND